VIKDNILNVYHMESLEYRSLMGLKQITRNDAATQKNTVLTFSWNWNGDHVKFTRMQVLDKTII